MQSNIVLLTSSGYFFSAFIFNSDLSGVKNGNKNKILLKLFIDFLRKIFFKAVRQESILFSSVKFIDFCKDKINNKALCLFCNCLNLRMLFYRI